MIASSRRTRSRYEHLLTGKGIDIGAGTDPLPSATRHWDKEDGDAQLLASLPNECFDFVFSSHCLEHLINPHEALHNWWRVLRTGGVLVCIVPDEDLYEQGVWPPFWNDDHKHTFTLHKDASWSPTSINLTSLITNLPSHTLLSLERHSDGYVHNTDQRYDQTANGSEASIAIVLRKQPQPHRVSALESVLECPVCEGEVIVHGQILAGVDEWRIRCARCGQAGKWTP